MKRNFSRVMLVAAAAMAFFACQKQEEFQPEFEEVNGLAFTSEKPSFDDETKTHWTGETIHWSKGDYIRVAYTRDGVWQAANGNPPQGEYGKLYASDPLSETTDVATFVVPGTFKGSEQGDYKFYGIYPSTLTSSTELSSAPSVSIDIPSEQTPAVNSFDAKADVMVAQSKIYNGMPKNGEKNGSISLKWNRLVAHGHITLKSLPVDGQEVVKSIVLTADAKADMVGKHKVNFNTQEVEKDGSNATNSITINGTNLTIDANGNVTFWACFLPCTWNSISVSVETDKATYTLDRDLVALNKTKTFAKNARNVLAINMTEANRAVKNVSSLPFVKDFSDKTGTNGITELDGFTVSGSVYNAARAIRLASGDYDGSITTQLLDLSQNFHVKVTASGWDDNELDLIVSTSEPSHTETVTLTAFGGGENFAEHIINFQPVSNSASLTFTAKRDVRCYIKKIEILEGHAVAAPVLKATAPNEIAAAGGEGSFNFTLANPQDGQSVSAESNVGWITGESVSGNTVTYTVAENTSEEPREGTITLSYEGAESQEVIITQAAAGATKQYYVKVTSAPTDWSGVYILGYTDGSTLKTLCGKNSGGNYGSYENLTLEDQSILSSQVPNECVLTIESTTNGYSLNVNNTYLGYTSISTSSNNYLWFNSSFESRKYEWTIKMDGENVLVTSVYNTSRVIKWNNASNGLRFACYTSSQSPIQLYKLMGGEPGDEEPKPAITVSSEASVNVEAAGATGTVSYTLTNAVADAKVSAQANQTWVTIGTITSTSVPFTVSENIGEQRTATITLSYGGAESKTVNITQAAAQSSGGETPVEPEQPETPSQGESKTATILFGTPNVKIDRESVTGTDSQQNTWTITTTGTSSWTQQPTYSQVGASSKPATSITFTTTLPANASVSNVSAKFGGFNGTAGKVALKVGDATIGTGTLNASSDVVVNSTSTASGNVVTVTVTNISKGVKCYNITVEYEN